MRIGCPSDPGILPPPNSPSPEEEPLRKYLIAALAAVLSIAVVATATGAGPASGTLKITPTKAGTKKKPKSIKLTLSVKNETPGTTASRIDVFLPRFVRASGKGLKTCSVSKAAGNKR